MLRACRQWALIDGQLLDCGFLESTSEPGEWVAVIEVVEVALMLARVPGHVEPGFRPGTGEGDVAPFLESRFAGSENEGPFHREALRGVARQRVRMADVARFEITPAELEGRAAVGGCNQRSILEVDPVDGCAGTVLDSEDVGVAEAHDAISGGKLKV